MASTNSSFGLCPRQHVLIVLSHRRHCFSFFEDRNAFTYKVIRVSCDLMEVLEIRKVHRLLFKLGLDLDVFVGSALVNTYLKFGLMDEVQ